ncbi:MAG: 4-alpha-glucanotransferase [Bacteroidota bacterium]
MDDGASLERLVTLAGVEPDYWDIWGNHHHIHSQAKRDILGALGLSTKDTAVIAASIRELEEQSWRRRLPPVLVTQEGDRPEIPLSLPAGRAFSAVTLQIRDETGAESEFVFRPVDAVVRDRRWADDQEVLRYLVPLPHRLPMGYHVVRLADRPDEVMRLIVAPRKCYLPPSLAAGDMTWGISAQLYTLHRPGNWGIGDFTDLRELVDVAADVGASVIGLNPLHALFLARPEEASPYSPSTRLFLNPLYIDVEAVPEFAECTEARAARDAADTELAACRELREIAYRRVKPIKLTILEALYACFLRKHDAVAAGGGRVEAFERFRREQGELLRRYALFESLSEEFAGTPWQQWPEPYRRPDSTEVEEFARANADRIRFFEYLQWQADEQLGRAQARALERGLSIGIYRDLAVGASRDGLDAWADQQVVVQSAKVGCPPDPFNMLGQDWGIPPLHPLRLRDGGYEPFIAMLRANMRHAGALRIDHVMGLMHLFWIPADGDPTGGAYVKYPFDDLLAVLALESQRNRCLVVGEDLGTVPAGFRERMAEANVLSYRVLYFEKDGDRFKTPAEYPGLALACVTTHDLATLAGFWQGSDLELKRRLNLYPSDDARSTDESARRWDKSLLLRALAGEGLLPDGIDPEDANGAPMSPALMAALHGYLARSPARILLVQIDDLMQELEQINLPGTVFERPNWRRRLSMRVDQLPGLPVMRALRETLADRSGG